MFYIVYKPPTVDWMPEVTEVMAGKRAAFGVKDMAAFAGTNLDAPVELRRSGVGQVHKLRGVTLDYLARLLQHVVGDSGDEVMVVDGEYESLEETVAQIGGLSSVRAVLGSATSANFPELLRVFSLLADAGVACLGGGIHLTARPQDFELYLRPALANGQAQVGVVAGPCDLAVMRRIVADIRAGNLQRRYTGGANMESNYWSNFPWLPGGRHQMRCVEVSRGCPYSCPFCSISVVPKECRRLQVREADEVLTELRSTWQRDAKLQRRLRIFVAENVYAQRKVFGELLGRIKAESPRISFLAQADCLTALDRPFLKLLRDAGCLSLLIGFESLNEQNLAEMHKRSSFTLKRKLGCGTMREAYAEAIRRIQDAGMSIRGAFMLGLPHDQPGCCGEVGDFIAEMNLLPHMTALTALPGAELFEASYRRNLVYGHPDDWARNSGPYPAAFSGMDLLETNLALENGLTPVQVQTELCAALKRVEDGNARPAMSSLWNAWRTAGSRGLTSAVVEPLLSALLTSGFRRGAAALARRINAGSPQRLGALQRLASVERAVGRGYEPHRAGKPAINQPVAAAEVFLDVAAQLKAALDLNGVISSEPRIRKSSHSTVSEHN